MISQGWTQWYISWCPLWKAGCYVTKTSYFIYVINNLDEIYNKYRIMRRPMSWFIGFTVAKYKQLQPINLDIGLLTILYLYIGARTCTKYKTSFFTHFESQPFHEFSHSARFGSPLGLPWAMSWYDSSFSLRSWFLFRQDLDIDEFECTFLVVHHPSPDARLMFASYTDDISLLKQYDSVRALCTT